MVTTLYAATDGGTSWTAMTNGLRYDRVRRRVRVGGDGTVYVGTLGGGVFRR